jgi:hypothetical protein
VFVDKESGVAAKASDVHRRLAKQGLESRLGKFVDAGTIKAKAQKAYEKKALHRVNTDQLWREYVAQRDARSALYQSRHAFIRSETAERVRAAKNDASNRRLTAKLLFKGLARKANCFAINFALGRTLQAIYRDARQRYQNLTEETRQLSWLDWLQLEAEKGRSDALQALRAARRAPAIPNTLTPPNQSLDMSPAPRGAQVTKQGTIIETVAGFPITRDEKGVYVHADYPDDAVLAMLHHSIERYGTKLRIRAPEDFQLRVGKLAGLNHLDVWFENPEVEQARQAGRAAAPAPISGAAQSYIHERNSKRNRISDIPFHRLWRSSDAGPLAFNGLRVVEHQTLLLLSNGMEMIVLPISPQQRRELASIQRGTQLNISSQLFIQTPVRGLER